MQSIDSLPDIWGEGALFAFSGVDGQTNVRANVVATLLDERYGLLFHTPVRRSLHIVPPNGSSGIPALISGDVVRVFFDGGDLVYTWASWHTLIGRLPAGTTLALGIEGEAATPATGSPVASAAQDGVFMLITAGDRFALSFGDSATEATERAQQGLSVDIERVVSRRLAWFDRLPVTIPPEHTRLANKCLSVMKVNTLAPEGSFADYWSTPDRVPHRNLWLWDSVFHSFAMNHADANLSWYFLKSVLDMQADDGMIPIQGSVEGWRAPGMTQPPLLAWGIWRNYQHTQNRAQLAYAFPRLEAYLQWNLDHRDTNGSGLLEWDIEENELCRSGESGMDNSPRFDAALLVDAVDFSTFQAHDMLRLATIADELGHKDRAAYWRKQAAQMSERIHTWLWDETSGLYMDRHRDGQLTGVEAGSGFLPLMLPDLPPERVDRLVDTLHDEARFNAAFPVPTVALNHPEWSTDMWRGATWINLNYLIIMGLITHNRSDVADWLRDKTLHFVNKYYRESGVIFEFFDAKDERKPSQCARKGEPQTPYDIRVKFDAIRDFHWSAALTLDLLVQMAPA